MKSNRLLYIDNLRIFLICLVILHHLAISYGAPGGWYYNEGQAGPIASIFLSLFVATNQSYFMGLLFLISAFFTAHSFQKKGAVASLKGRLVRLGIPLIGFYFILSPLTIYFSLPEKNISLWQFIFEGHGLGFGPLWFVEVLLLFAFIYALVKLIIPENIKKEMKPPKTISIIAFILSLGIITFIVRIWYPIGKTLHPFNFQLGFFPQYFACLFLGIRSYKNHWFDSIDFKNSIKWYKLAMILAFIAFPVMFYFGGAASTGSVDVFMGGWHWQALAYSLWEQIIGFALIIASLGIFKKWFNYENQLTKALSSNTYGMYIFHSLVLVGISVNLQFIQIPLLSKFFMLAVPSLLGCFLASCLFRRIPLVSKVI